ncbi:MAG: DUF2213 domain-containing protein [Rickettsiales bacterium]
MSEQEKQNAGRFPKRYFCRHMKSGVVGYDTEKIYVDDDCIKRSCPSFEGKPVYVKHQKVDLAKLQEKADGYVIKSFYNEKDGWFWAEFIIVSDQGHQAIDDGWSVSNAYIPLEKSGDGQHLSVDYKEKILSAEFTHLAIVPNPRYEEAIIMTPEQFSAYQAQKESELSELRNSKTEKGDNIMSLLGKVFKKERVEVKNSIPEDANLDDYIIQIEGKEKPLSEIINAVKKNMDDEESAKKEEEKKDKEETFNEDTEVSVGDSKMSVKELVNKYNAIRSKKNETDDSEKEKSDKQEDKKDEEEKSNAKYDELRNAHKNGETSTLPILHTQSRGLALGKQRYNLN